MKPEIHLIESELANEEVLNLLDKVFEPLPIPMILVDRNAEIKVINQVFADYLKHEKSELIGKNVSAIDKNTRFPYVLKSKKAEIAYKHKFENGHTAIVHRIPVLDDDGESIYGLGMVLFQDIEEFREIIHKNKQLHSELFHIKNELKRIQGAKYSWDNILGCSPRLVEAKYVGKKAALTTSNVLLLGDSGTGKELFAHAIHNDSGRGDYPFVRVNCAAIPGELLEAELFGYEEGAFTGARKGGKIGKFELANNGTIFLDEIGDMPIEMQVKLLRVLQEREIERIGGSDLIKLDVRVIAATNKDLEQLVQNGQFREDLFYRLHVMTIRIPSLKDRQGDIPILVGGLMTKISEQIGKYVSHISDDAMDMLNAYTWPGNIRELENVLERAINMTESDTIEVKHLPIKLSTQISKIVKRSNQSLKELLEQVEREALQQALETTSGNRVKAAKILGIGRSSFYEKLERYQLILGHDKQEMSEN